LHPDCRRHRGGLDAYQCHGLYLPLAQKFAAMTCYWLLPLAMLAGWLIGNVAVLMVVLLLVVVGDHRRR
jgi:hypothetical protein